MEGTPRFWFHAASVGEVTGAMATIRLLREQSPGAAIWLTVGTLTGFRFAGQKLGDVAEVQPFPLDLPWVIARAIRSIRPDVYVAMEGEFWPNLYRQLRNRQISTLLLNGRLSERSASRYRRAKGLFQPMFRHFHWLAMHSEADCQRAMALGAPPERTRMLGSAKYDSLLARTIQSDVSTWRNRFESLVIPGSRDSCGPECTEPLRVGELHQTSRGGGHLHLRHPSTSRVECWILRKYLSSCFRAVRAWNSRCARSSWWMKWVGCLILRLEISYSAGHWNPSAR
jgi:3-deoxy-D-manno-octulosonic-acid transferase